MAARAFPPSLPATDMVIPVLRGGSLQPAGIRSQALSTHAGLTADEWALAALLLASAFVLLVEAIPPVATVYREWPSGACRMVVTGDGAPGACGALPRSHEVVWVSPNWRDELAGAARSAEEGIDGDSESEDRRGDHRVDGVVGDMADGGFLRPPRPVGAGSGTRLVDHARRAHARG